MLNRKITASLQYVEKSHHVGFHIGGRIVYTVTDARLRSQVHHNIRPVFLKHPEHIRVVRQIAFDKRIFVIIVQLCQPVLFQPHVIIIVHVVETDHPRVLLQKAFG